jgi:ribonuclease BN (tRNA processing enzyme)
MSMFGRTDLIKVGTARTAHQMASQHSAQGGHRNNWTEDHTYVTDAADTAANRDTIVRLAHNADLLFIEAAFAKADVQLAAQRSHLTTDSAGRLARAAGVRRVEPFHFSPRYSGQEDCMVNEVMAAFAGEHEFKASDP